MKNTLLDKVKITIKEIVLNNKNKSESEVIAIAHKVFPYMSLTAITTLIKNVIDEN